MNSFFKIMDSLSDFSELSSDLKSNITPLHIKGVSDSVRAHLIFCVCQKLSCGGLVLAHNEASANEIYKDLCFFAGGDNVVKFSSSSLTLYNAEAKSRDVLSSRLYALDKLISAPDNTIVVTYPEALLSVTVPYEIRRDSSIRLSIGDEMETEELASRLVRLGYRREGMVEGSGQFSIRGGIVDVFPCGSDNPYRIEFFDTEVDSIRIFDAETQRTIDQAESFTANPANEILQTADEAFALADKLSDIADKLDTSIERESRLSAILKRDIEKIREGIYFPSMDKYIPYIYKKKPTILDYINQSTVIFADDPIRISERIDVISKDQSELVTDMYNRGELPSASGEYLLPYSKAIGQMEKHRVLCMSGISGSSHEFKPKRTFSLDAKSLGGFQGKSELLAEALSHYQKMRYKTIILAGTAERARKLQSRLEDDGISCSYQHSLSELPSPSGIVICGGEISRGFEYPLIQTAVIGSRELFGSEKKKKRRPLYRGKKGDLISDFTTLTPGDYVVHQNHGIGQYVGIEQLNVNGIRKDYLKINYKNSDTLYVPTDQLGMVYRYDKKDGASVRLNSLGGTDWAKTRQRVKAAAADMAKQLVALYAQRANTPGIAFEKDTEWQKSFEASFPYDETDDQLKSIDEVKADMENPHPMDRLLCGDVGYGKTEVALRAAFKAVMSGYQVAYLVPTTILANQHFKTFRQRMMDYPVNIEMLSRFCTPAAQKRILKNLSVGEADIVIGTHKLLGGNVKFKKLGLLIIDEEQRFGVAHKEKIKELKKDVDVLTLSATPIPRTLHMSLSGIRDMSIINQPPADRHPVATYVMEYDEHTVREAIERELARGGQVYYLFNRVEGIYKTANRLAELIPSARIAVAHGKMSENELERIMMEVAEGEIDVLVCTTIIETGLDIANVNTIIIENSDRLGLSQLYQLRGRVGRSNRLAYAYLTFRQNKMLTEDAEKRLLAMKEFTEFGSGFKIAMRDLEIRGTGNLIGAEQHGHMESVGYEMYCRLLEEAVKEQKGVLTAYQTETSIDLPVSAFIPEGYIRDHSRRIGAYRRIAAIDSRDYWYDVYDEIEDRYGTVPQSVINLMEIALIKKYASLFGISELIGSDDRIIMNFDTENLPDMQLLLEYMNTHPKKVFLTNQKNPRLHFILKKADYKDEYKYLKALSGFIGSLSGNDDGNL